MMESGLEGNQNCILRLKMGRISPSRSGNLIYHSNLKMFSMSGNALAMMQQPYQDGAASAILNSH
jgi:hypothetical protein